MSSRELKPGIHWVGAIDWDRRTFDELIPLPDGTSYNAYLVQGSREDRADRHGGSRLRGRAARPARGAGGDAARLRDLEPCGAGPLRLDPRGARAPPRGQGGRDPQGPGSADGPARHPRGTVPAGRGRRGAGTGRAHAALRPLPVGALARDHAHLARAGPGAVLLRSVRRAPRGGRGGRDRRLRRHGGRQALLRRDHDALPQRDPRQPVARDRAPGGPDLPEPRAGAAPTAGHPRRLPGLGRRSAGRAGGDRLRLDARLSTRLMASTSPRR